MTENSMVLTLICQFCGIPFTDALFLHYDLCIDCGDEQ